MARTTYKLSQKNFKAWPPARLRSALRRGNGIGYEMQPSLPDLNPSSKLWKIPAGFVVHKPAFHGPDLSLQLKRNFPRGAASSVHSARTLNTPAVAIYPASRTTELRVRPFAGDWVARHLKSGAALSAFFIALKVVNRYGELKPHSCGQALRLQADLQPR
jgi:hypothetical protein